MSLRQLEPSSSTIFQELPSIQNTWNAGKYASLPGLAHFLLAKASLGHVHHPLERIEIAVQALECQGFLYLQRHHCQCGEIRSGLWLLAHSAQGASSNPSAVTDLVRPEIIFDTSSVLCFPHVSCGPSGPHTSLCSVD